MTVPLKFSSSESPEFVAFEIKSYTFVPKEKQTGLKLHYRIVK